MTYSKQTEMNPGLVLVKIEQNLKITNGLVMSGLCWGLSTVWLFQVDLHERVGRPIAHCESAPLHLPPPKWLKKTTFTVQIKQGLPRLGDDMSHFTGCKQCHFPSVTPSKTRCWHIVLKIKHPNIKWTIWLLTSFFDGLQVGNQMIINH